MASLNEFAKRIVKHGKRIEVNANKEVIELAGLVSSTVILATPVKEGTARGNWFASLGSPILNPDRRRKDKEGSRTITRNNSTISSRTSEQSIYISNNLPYIKRLNEGYSEQAPAGYVEKAILTAKKHLKGVRLLRK